MPRGSIGLGSFLEAREIEKSLERKGDFYTYNLRNDLEIVSREREFFRQIVTEKPFYRLFKESMAKGSTVVDIGAHFGLYGVSAAKLGAENVYCFEPRKSSTETLEENIRVNGVDIQVVNEKVGNEKTLDSFFEGDESVDIVKIDVDGSELKVLESAKNLLEECKPVLFLELHSEQEIVDGGRKDVYKLLEDLGYSARKSWKRRGDKLLILDLK